jgi:hypothetical protein
MGGAGYQLQRDRECVQEVAQVLHHTAGDLHARLVAIALQPLLQCQLWLARSRLPVYSSIFRSRSATTRVVRLGRCLDRLCQHLPERFQLVNEFVSAIARSPADLSVHPGVALNRPLDRLEVLRFEWGADPPRISGR